LSCLQYDRVLDAIEAEFAQKQSELVLHGLRTTPEDAGRPVPLVEVRSLLVDRAIDATVKDTVWAALTRLCQEHGADWQLAAVWMMIPGLRNAVWRWRRFTSIDPRELEAEAVAGFLEALRKADPQRPGLGSDLWWHAYRHLGRLVERERREIPVADIELAECRSGGDGWPKDLLADAVHDGVLTVREADLISRTRLEGERLGSVAEQLGLRYHACQQRRARAEGRLAGYVLIDGDGIAEGGSRGAPAACPRPRTPVPATRRGRLPRNDAA
jgi:nucleotide-binding universal stress UspA family protein